MSSGIGRLAKAAAQVAGKASAIKENFQNSEKAAKAYPCKKASKK